MSYFGKYLGGYTGSWWGGAVIAFVKGRASSAVALLSTVTLAVRSLFTPNSSSIAIGSDSANASNSARSGAVAPVVSSTVSAITMSGTVVSRDTIALDDVTSVTVSSMEAANISVSDRVLQTSVSVIDNGMTTSNSTIATVENTNE